MAGGGGASFSVPCRGILRVMFLQLLQLGYIFRIRATNFTSNTCLAVKWKRNLCVCLCVCVCVCVVCSDICLLLFPSEEDGEHKKNKIWYYSTKAQLEELMESLDKEYWELDLHATLEEMREEVQAHMDVTEDLTNKARGSNKAYLTAVNGNGVFEFVFTPKKTRVP